MAKTARSDWAIRVRQTMGAANAVVVSAIQHPIAWGALLMNASRIQEGLQARYRTMPIWQAWLGAGLIEGMGLSVSSQLVTQYLANARRQKATRQGRAQLAAFALLTGAYTVVSYGFNIAVDRLPFGLLWPSLSLVALGLIGVRAIADTGDALVQPPVQVSDQPAQPDPAPVQAARPVAPKVPKGEQIRTYRTAHPEASVREIARELDMPASTVQYHVSRLDKREADDLSTIWGNGAA